MAVQIYSQKNNSWREAYNPLRGMNLARLMALLDAGERGQYADLQWLYHFMERSDPMVFSVMQRRRAVLLSCDWDVRQVAQEPGTIRSAVQLVRWTRRHPVLNVGGALRDAFQQSVEVVEACSQVSADGQGQAGDFEGSVDELPARGVLQSRQFAVHEPQQRALVLRRTGQTFAR